MRQIGIVVFLNYLVMSFIPSRSSTTSIMAQETGFADPRRMRQAFLCVFGQPPKTIRRSARRESLAKTD